MKNLILNKKKLNEGRVNASGRFFISATDGGDINQKQVFR